MFVKTHIKEVVKDHCFCHTIVSAVHVVTISQGTNIVQTRYKHVILTHGCVI